MMRPGTWLPAMGICLVLLATPLFVPATSLPPPLAEGNGIRKSASGRIFDKRREEELLGYAKGLLLERLGLGGAVTPPSSVTDVQRACFVTFYSGNRVMACFGGFHPRTASILREIEENVAGALAHDTRAQRITPQLARKLDVQITFPGEPHAITDYRQVDPRREGLFVENDSQGIAIVPGEAKTAAWALREAMRRLGTKTIDGLRLYKFRAEFITTRKP